MKYLVKMAAMALLLSASNVSLAENTTTVELVGDWDFLSQSNEETGSFCEIRHIGNKPSIAFSYATNKPIFMYMSGSFEGVRKDGVYRVPASYEALNTGAMTFQDFLVVGGGNEISASLSAEISSLEALQFLGETKTFVIKDPSGNSHSFDFSGLKAALEKLSSCWK